MNKRFPENFDWGVATTAIQIEGGIDQERTGRGRSMWPAFADRPGSIRHDDHPRHSARSYDFWPRDLEAIKRLNLKSYNFSTSWTRLLPEGTGRVNQKGLDYYNRIIDDLREAGISPNLSLYDWDIPLAYAERGGWENRDLIGRFSDYVDVLIRSFGDRVDTWMTFNEISTQALNGYKDGTHAPGRSSMQGFVTAYHHLMVAHGDAVARLREADEDCTISVVDNLLQYYRATVTDADRLAARRQWTDGAYYLLDALFKGELNQDFYQHYTEREGVGFDHIHDGDMDRIHQEFDEFGVNYFTSFNVADDPDNPGRNAIVSPSPGPQSPFGWTIDPHGMLTALRELKENYTGDMPLFIGECGIGQIDYPRPDGSVRDPERVDYLRQHLSKVLDAIDEGIPIKGFYVWSLMDNFEWQEGYLKRLGLFYTQYHRPEEYLIKDSGQWFAEVCKTNELS